MTKAESIIKELEEKEFDKFSEEHGLKDGEILLPELEEVEITEEELDEFVIMPTGKYEMLIRDSERLAAVTRYICSGSPLLKGVKALLEVE